MDFRTELSLKASPFKIDLKDQVLTIGSCFAQVIGQKLFDNKFQAQVNPFGNTYHPHAIHKLLNYACFQEYPASHTFLETNGIFFNYDFHSSFHAPEKSTLQKQLQDSIATLHYFIKSCKVILITYGTSLIFERVDTGEAVANCHKLPASSFSRRMTTVEEIISHFKLTFQALTSVNPGLRIILTVSPVRHVKDTLPLNSVSKSILRVACHQLASEHNRVEYFPALEVMMDDLRDYRYYKNDLIHPTELAEDYIWEKFSGVYFNKPTQHFIRQWGEIRKALAHKPFHADSNSHKKFLLETLTRLEELQDVVSVTEEISQLKSELANPDGYRG